MNRVLSWMLFLFIFSCYSLATKADTPFGYRVHGLNFSPYMDGQDPNQQSHISKDQLFSRMGVVQPYTYWVRTFGSTHGLEKSGAVAHKLGLKVALSAWISSDLAANENEIANLIAAAKRGEADMLIVGSEVMRRNDLDPTNKDHDPLSEQQLIEYINRVKQQVPGIPVTTADTYGEIINHPNLISVSDVVMINLYPYWESVSIDLAISRLDSMYQQVKAITGSKRIIVSETGWPSAGNTNGNAVPSPENASSYFYNFVSWALDHSVDYFYFEAFDESWKGSDGYWGVWDKWGQIKPGRGNVFMPCESNRPGIEFTHIPLYGNNNDRLQGQVCHVAPSNYGIAVYIYVPGYGWVNKPTWDAPITPINPDGSWNSIVVSGGADQNATMLAAFLLPTGYNPPLLGGSQKLPPELEQNSLARTDVTRHPATLSYDQVKAELAAANLEASGKFMPFNTDYFVNTYPPGTFGYDPLQDGPLQYYVEKGAATSFKPNVWFNSTYYLATYPDVKVAYDNHSADSLVHYAKFGVNEGRSPSPALENFDGARYLRENPDVGDYVSKHLHDFKTLDPVTGLPVSDEQAFKQGAIAHYIKFGIAEKRAVYDTSGAPISFTM